MRYLLFTNTPAHVHTYKHVVGRLHDAGHEVLVLGRDYTCTRDLLAFYDLPHQIYGRHEADAYSSRRFATELLGQFASIFRTARAYDPDLVLGWGSFAAFAGLVTRTRTVLLRDSSPAAFDDAVCRRFADLILTPAATRKDLGPNHYTFAGFKECAYLHPSVFEPRGDVRDRLGVGPDEPFVILRFNAFDALHDRDETGFTPAQRRRLVERLGRHARVFVSDEGDTFDFEGLPAEPYDLHPALIHEALSEAALLVADTGTMASEAALVGTPSIRYSGGDSIEFGEFIEHERHDLLVQLATFEDVLDRATDLVADASAGERWRRRRDDYMAGKVDLVDLLVAVVSDPDAVERLAVVERRRSNPSRPLAGD